MMMLEKKKALGIRLCCAVAWLALAAASNRTTTFDQECNDADGCPDALDMDAQAKKHTINTSPFLTASLSCVVAFILIMMGLKLFLVWRKRNLMEDWNNGSEMGGGIFRPGGMMNRIMRWQRPPTLAKQKQAEDLVALLLNDDSGTVWVACKPRKNAQHDEPMKMTPIHWFRVSDDSNSDDPMRLYAGPKFGADEQNVVLDSEGNVHAADTIVDIPDPNSSESSPGNAVPLGEDCCICFENKSDVRLYPCGHSVSCRLCFMRTLLTWTQEYKPNCPMCRRTIATFTIHDSASGPAGGSVPATRDSSWHSTRQPGHTRDASRHSNSSMFNRSARDALQPFSLFAGAPSNGFSDAGNRSVRSAIESVADRLQNLIPSSISDALPSQRNNNDVTVELGFSDQSNHSRSQHPTFAQGSPRSSPANGMLAPVVVL